MLTYKSALISKSKIINQKSKCYDTVSNALQRLCNTTNGASELCARVKHTAN